MPKNIQLRRRIQPQGRSRHAARQKRSTLKIRNIVPNLASKKKKKKVISQPGNRPDSSSLTTSKTYPSTTIHQPPIHHQTPNPSPKTSSSPPRICVQKAVTKPVATATRTTFHKPSHQTPIDPKHRTSIKPKTIKHQSTTFETQSKPPPHQAIFLGRFPTRRLHSASPRSSPFLLIPSSAAAGLEAGRSLIDWVEKTSREEGGKMARENREGVRW
ncbi:hypothetical protein Droror1_Dr00005959 [Drosera rotundifolia]